MKIQSSDPSTLQFNKSGQNRSSAPGQKQVRSFVNTRLDIGNLKDRVLINKSEGIIKEFSIKENNPENPVVSKKVLDSLSLGMVNFNQKERDTLATILSQKSESVKAKSN